MAEKDSSLPHDVRVTTMHFEQALPNIVAQMMQTVGMVISLIASTTAQMGLPKSILIQVLENQIGALMHPHADPDVYAGKYKCVHMDELNRLEKAAINKAVNGN